MANRPAPSPPRAGPARGADRVTQRRLVAILAADVVGYSRMMAADETATIARLHALRHDIIDPQMATYGGCIFNSPPALTVPDRPSIAVLPFTNLSVRLRRAAGRGTKKGRRRFRRRPQGAAPARGPCAV